MNHSNNTGYEYYAGDDGDTVYVDYSSNLMIVGSALSIAFCLPCIFAYVFFPHQRQKVERSTHNFFILYIEYPFEQINKITIITGLYRDYRVYSSF